ncbi:MAG: agmatinase [Candidatus Omnitrophota bacterium]
MKQYSHFTGPDGASTDFESSKIVILPVPYDRTSTWIKGADKGPFALLEASPQLELYDIDTACEVYKQGIYTLPPVSVDLSPEEMVKSVESEVKKLLDEGKFVVLLGGEHSVSIGSARAHAAKYNDLSVLHLDSHADLREEYEASRFNHACVAARIKEVAPVVEVGVRSMSAEEKDKLPPEDIFFARDIVGRTGWADEVASRLKDNVYVTIDLDVFDPAIMPSTGTPQPGGLDWYQVMSLLEAVARNKNVVGFDVVELCPNENNKAPDFLAAKLVYKFLSYVYKDNR